MAGDPQPVTRAHGAAPSPEAESAEAIKQFYAGFHDRIAGKRYNSPYWLRRYVHRQIYAQVLAQLRSGERVLDVGCGEGVLSCLAARMGCHVVGEEMSRPNVLAARHLASDWKVKAEFVQGDAERLPFRDDSFDVVVSSHVLEHLPDLDAGLAELYRVTADRALIAMPTCLNPAAWALLGGDSYWRIGRRSPLAVPFGFLRTTAALLRGDEGADEGYAGHHVPHVWRFPWLMRRRLRAAGFIIDAFEAGPLVVPYVAEYIPMLRRLQAAVDRARRLPVLRELGYGSFAVCRKRR